MGDWRFNYLRTMGREAIVRFDVDAEEAYGLAKSEGYGYVVVSKNLVLPPQSTVRGRYPPWSTFLNPQQLKLVHSSGAVSVYSLRPEAP